MLLHVEFPQRLTENAPHDTKNPFPARPLFQGPCEHLAVELKLKAGKYLWEGLRTCVNEAPTEICLERKESACVLFRLLYEAVALSYELRLPDDLVVRLFGNTKVLKIGGPRNRRRKQSKLRNRHRVILLLFFAPLRSGEGHLCEPRFNGENRFCPCSRFLRRIAEQAMHTLHIGKELCSNLHKLLVAGEIVVAVGKREPRLLKVETAGIALFGIRFDHWPEKRRSTNAMQFCGSHENPVRKGYIMYTAKHVLYWRETIALYPRFVHSRKKKVAEFLPILTFSEGCVLRKPKKEVFGALSFFLPQHHEHAPTPLLCRNRVVITPSLVHMRVKIFRR